MGKNRDGRRFAVPPSRRLTWDLLWFHKSVPLCAHDRRMSLAQTAAARLAATQRISWPALFLKAAGLAANDFPELRQTWFRWPFAHIYQHPHTVAVLTIQRELDGEPWLFWGRIHQPEELSLLQIQQQIDQFQKQDPRREFRRALQLAALPLPLRRAIWWWNLNVSPRSRARRLGTCFLSTLAGRNTEIQLPPSVHTACFTWGPLDEFGRSRVTLAYDHRIMDGARTASILERLEELLTGPLLLELQKYRSEHSTEHP
ncbi:MAG: hypothetical protein ACKO2L_21495 [Planctomycetaceae bacterium]